MSELREVARMAKLLPKALLASPVMTVDAEPAAVLVTPPLPEE
jgi:hypothetical protein